MLMNNRMYLVLLTVGIVLICPGTAARASEHSSNKPADAPAASNTHAAPAAATHAPAEPASGHAKSVTEKHQEPAAAHAPTTAPAAHAAPSPDAPSALQALAMLKEGNARYATDAPHIARMDARRRTETAQGQKPFVTIITCSDSRVSPELIFDRGIGELFVVRDAGNVCGEDELASVEYAVEHLHTPLVLVMGHSKCGAVTAAASGAALPGHLSALMKSIAPAIATARHDHPDLQGEAIVPSAIVANAYYGIEHMIRESEIVAEFARAGKVQLAAAIYDIATGKVEFLGAHPQQAELLKESQHPVASHADAPHTASHGSAAPPHAVASAAPTHQESPGIAAPKLIGSNQGPVDGKGSPHEASATSRESATRPASAVEAWPQPEPHALPGLLERCMAEEMYRAGEKHLEAGDYAEAAARFQAAAEMDPSLLAARNDLAGVYCLQQKYEEALKLYTGILAVDGQYRHALRGAALCHASLKQYDAARSYLEKLLTLDRRDGRAWLELGDVCFLSGDAGAAREHWTRAQQDGATSSVGKQAALRLKVHASTAPAATRARH